MIKNFLSAILPFLITITVFQNAIAQNTSPFWSLAGNSNATSSSKLGTTNNISLRFYTNNIQRMRIDSENGWVGIGTPTPTERLHINSVAGANAFRAQVNGNTKLLVHSGGGVSVGGSATPPANGLYVAGNVGVGTSTPTSKLHIAGSGPYSTAVRVANGGLRVDIPWSTGDESVGIYSEAGIGVQGVGMVGIEGEGMVGVSGTGYTGVQGSSGEGGGNAVEGYATDGTGVYGNSYNSFGGNFESNSSWGLRASTQTGFYAGVFYGNVYTSGSYLSSDKSLKQNIEEFTGAMTIINKLRPRYYEYKTDEKYAFMHLAKGRHYGLLAQDVEEVLPNLVSTTAHEVATPALHRKPAAPATISQSRQTEKKESLDLKAVNYTELIPIMIKGMQEQEVRMQQQDELIEKQQQQIDELKNLVRKLTENRNENTLSVTGVLQQATPNPSKGSTRIAYQLPENAGRAQLIVTDNAGKTVKAVMLSASGVVDLNTASLSSGIYHYSLVIDGKVQQTKKLTVLR